MKLLVAVTCLLATTTVVRGFDQDTIIAKYIEYLMPDMTPCIDKFQVSEDEVTNIQQTASNADNRKLGCVKACVMRRIGMLTSTNDMHLEPVYKMIDVVHAGNDAEIQDIRKIAEECLEVVRTETDECNIGTGYTDCYVQKLFN